MGNDWGLGPLGPLGYAPGCAPAKVSYC